MYADVPDPYCYPGTTVLTNRPGFRDQARLDAFEAEVTAERAAQPLPAGGLGYSHYRAIHRHLFQDVYAWAGKIRTVRTERHYKALDARAFAGKAAHFLAELNAIHPFREGNGRTQLSFLVALAERAGHLPSLEELDPNAMLEATIASFGGNERPLADLIEHSIQ
jgi:cell filamentation protein